MSGTSWSRLNLPGTVKGSFEWEVQFTRTGGNGSVLFLFPMGESFPYLELDGDNGRYSGVGRIDGLKPGDAKNPTSLPGGLATGVRHTLVMEVRLLAPNQQASVRATLDGVQLLAWKGPRSALSGEEAWKLPEAGGLGLGAAGNSRVVFHNAWIRAIGGRAPNVVREP